jgi:hypothetical protein
MDEDMGKMARRQEQGAYLKARHECNHVTMGTAFRSIFSIKWSRIKCKIERITTSYLVMRAEGV